MTNVNKVQGLCRSDCAISPFLFVRLCFRWGAAAAVAPFWLRISVSNDSSRIADANGTCNEMLLNV